ncbi:MAG: TRAP transporter large permease subunit [bacterium]
MSVDPPISAAPAVGEEPSPESRHPVVRALHRVENLAVVFVFGAAIVLPLIEAVGRLGAWTPEGSAEYLRQLVLWLTFLGGLLATRDGRHLRLSTAEILPEGPIRRLVGAAAMGVAAAIAAVLSWASWEVVAVNREVGKVLPIGLPVWVGEAIMPLALAVIALRFVVHADRRWSGRLLALAIVPLGFVLGHFAPGLVEDHPGWLTVLILAATVLGAPVFCAMAAVAMVFYFSDGTPITAVSAEIYRLVSSPTLPAIPLLTACGYVLAETRAAERLVRFFKAMFGWLPGGMAILVAGVCGVFTTFTGGSGVTIIALGGLVYGMLKADNYPEGFALGHVTASSSLGLLFPPSLPVILYAVVVSQSPEISVPADRLYFAGLVPGVIMGLAVAAYGMVIGRRVEPPRPKFDARELLAAAWGAKWELSVPVVVIVLFAGGFASMVEAAAAAAAYAIIVECAITRDLHPIRDLPRVLAGAGALVGAVLILLAAAMGLSSYALVEAELPDLLLSWVEVRIESPLVFLLALNGLLLVLGSLLEIYSAIVILPPILAPIALHYGIDPVHLGIIFLANLELGFLTPPVGLNLFLAAARFQIPMVRLYRTIVPYILILLATVLLITYMPSLSVGVANWLGGPD